MLIYYGATNFLKLDEVFMICDLKIKTNCRHDLRPFAYIVHDLISGLIHALYMQHRTLFEKLVAQTRLTDFLHKN